MTSELNRIDLKSAPSLPELVDEVRKTRKSRIIRADGEDVAILSPLGTPAPKRRHWADFPAASGIPHYSLEEVFGAAHDTGGPRDFDQMIREAKEERAENLMLPRG